MMKYLSNKDFYTEIDESTGNKVKLILASGIRKIINKEKNTIFFIHDFLSAHDSKGQGWFSCGC